MRAIKDKVAQTDLEKIVTAGINSQSAMNGQPWHFSVVTNKDLLNKISDEMASGMKRRPAPSDKPDGDKLPPPPPPAGAGNPGPKAAVGDSPVAIIISAKDGSEFDAVTGATTRKDKNEVATFIQ